MEIMRHQWAHQEMTQRWRIDSFIIDFFSIFEKIGMRSSVNIEDVKAEVELKYNAISDLRNIEIVNSEPLRTYAGIGNISENFETVLNIIKHSQTDNPLCRYIKSSNTPAIGFFLYCFLGDKMFNHRGLMTRIMNILKTNIAEASRYSYRTIDSMSSIYNTYPFGTDAIRSLIEGINSVPDNIDINGCIHILSDALVSQSLYPNELPINKMTIASVYYGHIKKQFLKQICKTRDPIYKDVFEEIINKAGHYEARAFALFGAFLGDPFKPRSNFQGTLFDYYAGNISDEELNNKFDKILSAEKPTFRFLIENNIGIGLKANVNITKRRYLKILSIAGRSRISNQDGFCGPFIEEECPLLALKIMRREYNDRKKP